MDNTIKLHNSQRNINMGVNMGDSGGRTGQQDTLSWAACALLTFHYPVKYSKVKQAGTDTRTQMGMGMRSW